MRALEDENSKIKEINHADSASIRDMKTEIATLKSERNDCQRRLKEMMIMEQVGGTCNST
jgi:hypothetical protein